VNNASSLDTGKNKPLKQVAHASGQVDALACAV